MTTGTTIPATPGTFIVARRHGHTISIPVIAWRIFPFGGDRPSAIGPNFEYAGAKDDTAVLHPMGFVTLKVPVDDMLVFETIGEWESFVDKRESVPPAEDDDPVGGDDDEPGHAGPNPGTGFVMQGEDGESHAGPNRPISFGTKTYKSKSFWRLDNYLFIIEAGEPYPNDDRAVKVKRDDYFALRKDDRYEVIDPHTGELGDAPSNTASSDDDMDAADLV